MRVVPTASMAWMSWLSRPPRGGPRTWSAGPRPAFLECRTYRFRAHSMFDAELYRDEGESRGVEADAIRS